MGCISTSIPNTKQPNSLYTVYYPLNIDTKVYKSIDNYRSLYTMSQVSFTRHNITNHSLILFPLQFCIPHCIILLFYHLEWLTALIAAPVPSLGPWGTSPCGTKLLSTCCSLAHFPMDTNDSTNDHMKFCITITRQHRPHLGRFDPSSSQSP